MTTGFEGVDVVMFAARVLPVRVRRGIQKVEVVEEERVVVVVRGRIAPADARDSSKDESVEFMRSVCLQLGNGPKSSLTHATSLRSVGWRRFRTTSPFRVAGSNSSPVKPRSTISGDCKLISSGGSGP